VTSKYDFLSGVSQGLGLISNTRNSNDFERSSIIDCSINFRNSDFDPFSLTRFKGIYFGVGSVFNLDCLLVSIIIFDNQSLVSFSRIISVSEFDG